MHIYILGICGTFMGSLAVLAKEMGYRVSGCDENVYPPMSTQLQGAGILLDQGYRVEHLACKPDLVVIGNAMSRGNLLVEEVLAQGIRYTSGPQFLHDYVLPGKWVLAVAGTHGKTTTASMLAWILEFAGREPGFLIGGVLKNFPFSSRVGGGKFFVVEADEYDTAFFDKRSKFLHYSPKTLVLNNLEFDHADIFENLEAIKKQFHHLMRIVPCNGRVVCNHNDPNITDVISRGNWSQKVSFGTDADWQASLVSADGSLFDVLGSGNRYRVAWELTGQHNVNNALAAIAAAEHVGVSPAIAAEALCSFAGVKRRMEKFAEVAGVTLYDDFAHHPTAIATTLDGIRARVSGRLLAVIEPRSNTMRMGVHGDSLRDSVSSADRAYWFMGNIQDWAVDPSAGSSYHELQLLIADLVRDAKAGDHIVLMSNGGFLGLHRKLQSALEQKFLV
jgi:UDP-N-acetylmuramate: L-alanyl-gamma-D-glutamyl-meso-diaminopimelate ligase